MQRKSGVCQVCRYRTADMSAHSEWCWPAAAKQASTGSTPARPAAPHMRACRDCGAWLTDLRRERCLDCEVNGAFDALEQVEARRQSSRTMYRTPEDRAP